GMMCGPLYYMWWVVYVLVIVVVSTPRSSYFSCPRGAPALHSFPTRRSSDLQDYSDFLIVLYLSILITYYCLVGCFPLSQPALQLDRKSTRLNSSHVKISYAVFCLKKKKRLNITHLKRSYTVVCLNVK